jgi:hypothetical protein
MPIPGRSVPRRLKPVLQRIPRQMHDRTIPTPHCPVFDTPQTPRSPPLTTHDSRSTIHDSRSTTHDSRLTIHDPALCRPATPEAAGERLPRQSVARYGRGKPPRRLKPVLQRIPRQMHDRTIPARHRPVVDAPKSPRSPPLTLHDPRPTTHDPRPTPLASRSTIHDPRSTTHAPCFTIHDPRFTTHASRLTPLSTRHSPLAPRHPFPPILTRKTLAWYYAFTYGCASGSG